MNKKLFVALVVMTIAPLVMFGQLDDKQVKGVGEPAQLTANTYYNLHGKNERIPISGSSIATGAVKSQFIIPQDSLVAMNYSVITGLSFRATKSAINWGVNQFEVYVKEVTFTEYNSCEYYDWNDMTLVYTGNLSVSNCVMNIPFQNTYLYEGGNLMIGFKQIVTGSNYTVTWVGVEIANNSAIAGGYGSIVTFFSPKQPQTTFSYIPQEAPSCVRPHSIVLDESGATSVVLNWTQGEGQESWQLVYSTDASFDPDQASIVEVDERPFTLPNLAPETEYYLYLRANCGDDSYSYWSDQFSFATVESCVTPSDLYFIGEDGISADFGWTSQANNHIVRYKDNVNVQSEILLSCDFENGLPSGWTTINSDGDAFNWTFDGTGYTSYEGLGCMYSLSYNHSTWGYLNPDNWLVTPSVELGGSVTFYAKGKSMDQSVAQEHFAVYVSTTDTNVGSFTQISQEFVTTSDYALYSVDLSDYQGQVGYIAIRHFRVSRKFSLSVDNLTVFAEPSVWTEVTDVTSSPYNLSNLTPHSFYEVQVKAVCGDDETSRWSNSLVFNTTGNCDNYIVDCNHPLREGFEGSAFPPACWTAVHSGDCYWKHHGDNTSYSSSHPGCNTGSSSAYSDRYGTDVRLYMPTMKIMGAHATLTFWSCNTNTNLAGSNSVLISTDNGSHFTSLWTTTSFSGAWTKTTLSLDSYLNKNVIIMFRYRDNNHEEGGHGWYIDDVEINVPFEKSFVVDGNWNVASNWSPAGVPASTESVLVNAAATIPSGYVAQINSISFGENGSLTIADGGQLLHNNNGVEAVVKKTITGYGTSEDGWHLIATPVERSHYPTLINNLVASNPDNYDLYGFAPLLSGNEWRNYKADGISFVDNAKGYLYANVNTVNVEYVGELKSSASPVTVPLVYKPTSEEIVRGGNLLGNPFPCDAYLANGENFYRMNENGSELMLVDGVIHPCEGIFVVATSTGQSVTFTRTAPQSNRGQMNLNLSNRDGKVINRARIHFDETEGTEVFSIRPNSTKLFFSKDDKNYAAVGSETSAEMPLYFKASENGTYTITVNCDEQMSYAHLIDNLTGDDIDLLATPTYTFESRVTDYASRFKVVFMAQTDDFDSFAFVSNGQLVILNPGNGSALQIIDMMGRVVLQGEAVNSISLDGLSSGMYVLRLIKGNEVKTQKIVL